MKDKFVTEDFEIDLSGLATNFTEENPRFKDSLWNQYTLPVDIHYDRDFLSKIAQYSSFNNANLPKKHEGVHIFEGRVRKGTLTFSDFRNKWAKVQIDSGFEEIPNFEKPLSELPFEHFEVSDIYDHAQQIVSKKYPETNYNFPKLYTDEFDLESDGYKFFDSFINNRARQTGGSAKLFAKNEVRETEEGWDVINRNIIHPMPYILHVLKVGFQDAGFKLQGDILQDPLLLQRVVYSGKHYFTTADQQYQKSYIYEHEYYDSAGNTAKWSKSFTISAPGKYRLKGKIFSDAKECYLNIYKNGILLANYSSGNTSNYLSFDKVIEIDISDAEANPAFKFEYSGPTFNNKFNNEGVNIGVAELNINPIRQNTENGEPIPFVFNHNRIDLRRAMPDLTFGDVVTTIKNWRNYDLVFENGIVYMNRIVIDKTKEPDDFRHFEVEDPYRSRNDKQAFLITFPDAEGAGVQNVYFDESGYSVNPVKKDANATEININGFCLPLETFRATTTAKAFQEEGSLMLVHYDGLNQNGDNHATNPAGLHGSEFAESVRDWYMNRLTNFTFKWSFRASKSQVRNFNIRSEIFAYNKKHWIKSWVKNSVSEKIYEVEIETETF